MSHSPKSTTFSINITETRVQQPTTTYLITKETEQTHEPVGRAIIWKPHTLLSTEGTVLRKIGTGKTNVKEIEQIYILQKCPDATETNRLQDSSTYKVERTFG